MRTHMVSYFRHISIELDIFPSILILDKSITCLIQTYWMNDDNFSNFLKINVVYIYLLFITVRFHIYSLTLLFYFNSFMFLFIYFWTVQFQLPGTCTVDEAGFETVKIWIPLSHQNWNCRWLSVYTNPL